MIVTDLVTIFFAQFVNFVFGLARCSYPQAPGLEQRGQLWHHLGVGIELQHADGAGSRESGEACLKPIVGIPVVGENRSGRRDILGVAGLAVDKL